MIFFVVSLLVLLFPSPAYSDSLRSFNELFSNLGEDLREKAFSPEGLIRSMRANRSPELLSAHGSGIDLYSSIMKMGPSYLAESLLVIPYEGRTLGRLDAYNALGNIKGLQGRLYHSHTRNSEIPLFEEATRIESGRRNTPIPDPPPSRELPLSETVYIRLKDANFGNSYYRGDILTSTYGILYSLTNTRNLSFMLFPVMREGKFIALLYMEPLAEGMLVYSMAGADASDFVANMVDIPSAISKRLAVFIAWISDGIKAAR